jgi:putative nucleotidyltransferase with HDIG domain
MKLDARVEWWPLYVRALTALFGFSVIFTGVPAGTTVASPLTLALLLALLVAAGLPSVVAPIRVGGFPLARHSGVALELLIVSFIVFETGGRTSFFYFLYVPILLWATAGRGIIAGVIIGWVAATAFAIAAGVQSGTAAGSLPRAMILVLAGVLIGMIEERRAEGAASVLHGVEALTRQANTAVELRAAVTSMAPLDLAGRARQLLERSLRLADASHGLVVMLDGDGQPVVEAGIGTDGEARRAGESLPATGVLSVMLRSGLSQTVADASRDASWASVLGEDGARSAVLMPLAVAGAPFGALLLARRDLRLFAGDQTEAARALAEAAAPLLWDARAMAQSRDSMLSTVKTLAAALEAKDPHTRGHSQRVAACAVAIATDLGLPAEEIERIHWASMLHDIGKIATPEAILRKRGPLTDEERAVMNLHPERGASILREMPPFKSLSDDVHYHQEAYDGSGYPEGLAGTEIPLGARIIRVADTFDAVTSHRPYRPSRSVEEATAELQRMAGSTLDPVLVEVFLRILKEKPPFEIQLRLWREH